jgi:predicted nucleic acid-binding protein
MIVTVVDTNILLAALLKNGGSSRTIIRACLAEKYAPLIGPALFAEYEDVLSRDELFSTSPLSMSERHDVFDGFLKKCR